MLALSLSIDMKLNLPAGAAAAAARILIKTFRSRNSKHVIKAHIQSGE